MSAEKIRSLTAERDRWRNQARRNEQRLNDERAALANVWRSLAPFIVDELRSAGFVEITPKGKTPDATDD